MGSLIKGQLDRWMTPPPMPPEAMPSGLVGKVHAVQSVIEIAWKAMGYQMFFNGLMVGIAATIIIFGAVLFRGNMTALVRRILTSGL